MTSPAAILNSVAFVLVLLFNSYEGCGISTHMIVAHRARNHYRQVTASYDYRKLMDKHEDAFIGGSPFPDAFYGDFCYDGMYKNVSDDSQLAPFLNATINYIRKLPKPWDDATEKLVVFTMAMMSHQVSNALWYGLGIDQGFISTMANINFHGNLSVAKESGNFGSDITTNYMYSVDYIDPQDNWYIPVDDLFNIYQEIYGSQFVDKDAIQTCTSIMLVESTAYVKQVTRGASSCGLIVNRNSDEGEAILEFIGSAELYQDIAATSPFMIDHILDYFVGGVESMASWSVRKWHDAVTLIEEGPSACKIPPNSIFINCTKGHDKDLTLNKEYGVPVQSKKSRMKKFYPDDVEITRAYRGVHIRPGAKLREKIREKKDYLTAMKEKVRPVKDQEKTTKTKDGVGEEYRISYYVDSIDSLLGWSLASGDIDGDGNDDLVIGAPGYSEDEDPQFGRVYILYGEENGLPHPERFYYAINLDNATLGYNRIFSGESKAMSKFGFSVTVVDVNLDGKLDLAVGAPSFSNDGSLGLNGMVYIYFGDGETRDWKTPDVLLTCQSRYCSLGYSLSSADVNGDGHPDLLMGCPFNNTQRGFVTALPSASTFTGKGQKIAVETLTWKIQGDQTYSWFGHSVYSKMDVVLIGQPYYRKCVQPDCPTFSATDIPGVGKTTLLNLGSKVKLENVSVSGLTFFDMAGYSADIGDPFGNGSVVVAVGMPNANVFGEILTVPVSLTQAGSVFVYMLVNGQLNEIAHYDSDRRYSEFGSLVRFSDINHDGIDDLFIGTPYRNDDPTEIINLFFNGKVYAFYGGEHFPLGNATNTPRCKTVAPCPHIVANLTTSYYGEDKSYFGSSGVVLNFKNQTQLVVGASRNTDSDYDPYIEESGKVYVFNTWK